MNTPQTTLTLADDPQVGRGTGTGPAGVLCADLNTLRGVRCVREVHDDGTLHRAGLVVWGARPEPEPFVAEWLRRARDGRTSLARDETEMGRL